MALTEKERDYLEAWRVFRDEFSAHGCDGVKSNLADAMLRLFPADDDEPITDEWVRETWPDSSDGEAVIKHNPSVTLTYMGGGDWSLFVDTHDGDGKEDNQWLRNVATRGDVRAFLRGMGVEPKGGE